VRYGLAPSRATGQQAIAAIVRSASRARLFKSLFDFAVRVDQQLNKRTVEVLIKGGAFDNPYSTAVIGRQGV
jgi:DNA polymerase III alpha subunit